MMLDQAPLLQLKSLHNSWAARPSICDDLSHSRSVQDLYGVAQRGTDATQ